MLTGTTLMFPCHGSKYDITSGPFCAAPQPNRSPPTKCASRTARSRFGCERGKGQGSGVERRRNSSCHSTLIIRHSLAPDTLAPFALRQYQGPRPSTLNSNHTTPHPTNDAESVPAPSLTVTARLRTELIVHHLLLLLPSFFFLFFNPDP